ncbi:MAG: hypothetical protein M1434_10425 [Chloroflexi bacterium]|nr:hypothetical protein [Chloroflexota bacterium]MCL5275141.1 hypothetical protein [Chloroflexota bacterium]
MSYTRFVDFMPTVWARGRGCVLSVALIALPYYLETNPVIVEASWHAIEEVPADYKSGGSGS